MKTSWIAVLFFILIGASCAFAQKADVSYWGGQVIYKTYEPWYYEVVKEARARTHVMDKLHDAFGTKKAQKQKEERAALFEETMHNLETVANQYPQMNQERYLLVYVWLTKAYKTPFQDYSLKVRPNDTDGLSKISEEGFHLLRLIFTSDPKQRNLRPEPEAADLVNKEFIRLQFRTEQEIIHIGIDLTQHTLEIYRNEPKYQLGSIYQVESLMDLKDFRKK